MSVYFPQARGPDPKSHKAEVVGCFSEYDDDVVLLQLVEDTDISFLYRYKVAVLGSMDESYNNSNPFRSYGYAPIGESISVWVDGHIKGHNELNPSSNKNLLCEYVQLECKEIRSGLSGAPLLDTTRNLVVGIIFKRFNPGDDPGKYYQDGCSTDFGRAVDTKVLSFSPMNLPFFFFQGRGCIIKFNPRLW